MSEGHETSLDELAAGVLDEHDAKLLRSTARVFDAVDPMPVGMVERIQFTLTLDALHAEVAELQRSAGLAGLAGVRSDAIDEVQTITFTSAALTTMIKIAEAPGERVRVDGWIAPGRDVLVELRVGGVAHEAFADDDGRFVFDDIPRGLAQLVLRPPAASGLRAVVTPSFQL